MHIINLSSLRSALVAAILVPCAALVLGCEGRQDAEDEDVASSSEAVYHAPLYVGVRCQQDYQNSWQSDVGNSDVWWRCSNFINQIQSTDTVAYYYNLVGAKPMWESTYSGLGWSYGGLDSVDVFYSNEHGGISGDGSAALWCMWDQGQFAYSTSMRLGQQSMGLSVFTTFACDTMRTSDGKVINRWLGLFAGGLRVANGAHDLLYAGNNGSSADYVARMQNGETIGSAWLESTWYADNNNHPSIMNVGADGNDCWNRMGATLANIKTVPRLRDGQIGYMCWSGWNGI
jgi:hypothetical protein